MSNLKENVSLTEEGIWYEKEKVVISFQCIECVRIFKAKFC